MKLESLFDLKKVEVGCLTLKAQARDALTPA